MDFEIYIDNSIVNDNRIVYFENFDFFVYK